MNNPLKIALFGAAGATLFLVSYVGFAKVVGADMSRLPVVGGLFSAPPSVNAVDDETATEDGPSAQADAAQLTETRARELRTPQRAASIIDFFTVQAPFSSEELKRVSDELLASANRLELERRELALRESALDERQEKLDEDFATLTRLQTSLDDWASELRQRSLELDRDASIKLESDARVHARIGELFAEGDPEELVTRLGMFAPDEAAKILVTLSPDRANKLLAAMKVDERWLEYAEAYAARAAAARN